MDNLHLSKLIKAKNTKDLSGVTPEEIYQLIAHAELTLKELQKTRNRRVYGFKGWERRIYDSAHETLKVKVYAN
jgi:hypothetical protein